MSSIPPGQKALYLDGQYVGDCFSSGDIERDKAAIDDLLAEKGLARREVTVVQAMFRQALSFATTSSYLYKNDLTRVPRNPLSVAPFIVNIAFAIELYLKTLARAHGVELRVHDLVVLWEGLPRPAMEALNNSAADEDARVPLPGYSNIQDSLSSIRGAFLEWRYVYEQPTAREFPVQTAVFVAKVLHEACVASGQT